MVNRILFAGFGGQGILFAAKVTAYAGLASDQNVTWLPSYGPEMRGGTSNCTVCVGNEPIACPIVNNPENLLALNEPSFAKFINAVAPGGCVVYDSALINSTTDRTDISVCPIPASQIARDKGLNGLGNIIALGYLAKKTGFMDVETLKKGIEKSVPASKQAMIAKNFEALETGFNY